VVEIEKIIKLVRKRLVIGLSLLLAGVSLVPGISAIEIENNPPIADADGPYTGFEGSPVTFDASLLLPLMHLPLMILTEMRYGSTGILMMTVF
jgi:hypothetical protein